VLKALAFNTAFFIFITNKLYLNNSYQFPVNKPHIVCHSVFDTESQQTPKTKRNYEQNNTQHFFAKLQNCKTANFQIS